MNEPPRLGPRDNFYSDNSFGNSPRSTPGGSGGFSPVPPLGSGGSGFGGAGSGSTARTIAIAFGATCVVLLVLCSGFAGWAYWQFNTPNTMTEAYREHREPTGGSLPKPLAQVMDAAPPLDPAAAKQTEELMTFITQLANGELTDEAAIDYRRAVEEMKSSGLAVGMTGLNQLLMQNYVKEAFSIPELGSYNTILDVRPLANNQEVRVVVVSHQSWEEYPQIVLLYLIRNSAGWRLYDHRDVTQPLSETQYFATTTGLPETDQNKVYDLAIELLEIYEKTEMDAAVKAQQSLVSYTRRRFPEGLRAQGQYFAAYYLLLYRDAAVLESFLAGIPQDEFADLHHVRGQLALMKEQPEIAYQHAATMVTKIGWHPAAAMLAGRAAQSDEQRRQAARWLQRLIVLSPEHTAGWEAFFRIAEAPDVAAWVEQLALLDDGQARLLRGILAHDSTPQIAKILASERVAAMPVAALYLQLQQAHDDQRPAAAMEFAKQLLQHPQLPAVDTDNALTGLSLSSRVWDLLVEDAEQAGALESLLDFDDPLEDTLRKLRDGGLQRSYARDGWEPWFRVLQRAAEDPELSDEPETATALGIAHLRLGRVAEASEILVPLVQRSRDELLSMEEPPAYGHSLLTAAGEACVVQDVWRSLVDALDEPEVAYLVLRSAVDEVYPFATREERPIVQQIDTWYASQTSSPQYWLDYYQGVDTFAEGDWETADAHVAAALSSAKADERAEDYSFGRMVYYFAPYSDDASEWLYERVDWAARSGRLVDLLDRVAQAEDFDEYVDAIEWQLRVSSDVEAMRLVSARLQATGVAEHAEIGHAIHARGLARSGDFLAANSLMKHLYQQSKNTDNRGSYFYELVDLAVETEAWRSIDELAESEPDADSRATLAALRAIKGRDTDQLVAALREYESEYVARRWCNDLGIVRLKQMGAWPAVNALIAVDPSLVATEYEANSLIILPTAASEQRAEIEAELSSHLGPSLIPVDELERLPGAVAAWTAETDRGRVLAVAYDEPLDGDYQTPTMTRLRRESAGLVCLSWMQNASGPSPAKPLRELAIALGSPLQASGYYDFQTDSWFQGDGWQAELGSSVEHGFNRTSPREFSFPTLDYSERFTNTDESMYVSRGLIMERLAVEPHAAVELATSELPHYRLQSTSYLVPALSIGDIVQP